MRVSVVVVTYRRLSRINDILKAWLDETPDVWLCDCSVEGVKTSLPVNIIRAMPDPGNKIRHAVATMTSGDLIIKADDDVMPRRGIADAFVNHAKLLGPAIYGIHGRVFRGPDYYHNTKLYGSKSVPQAQLVDFVGVMTCTPRRFLAMDLRGCYNEVEDLYWQMRCYPEVKKYVIATDKFHHLSESKDKGRLCGNTMSKDVRNKYYGEYYRRNYA